MFVSTKFINVVLFTALVVPAVLSCQLEAEEGQLSCAASPCPDGLYCHEANLRCYSSQDPSFLDSDTLNGTDTSDDACPLDDQKTEPGECGCGQEEDPTDTDGDGTPDCADDCPADPDKIDPGICGCGMDDSLVGTKECVDHCPDDPAKMKPGLCGCGVPDVDSDGDGLLDCRDGCPQDGTRIEPGLCGCNKTCADLCIEVMENDSVTISCEDGIILSINAASFGDLSGYCESETPPATECQTDAPFANLEAACEGKTSCLADADKDLYGEQCTKIKHFLVVEYTCRYNDSCPDDPNKNEPGLCGCGNPETC